MRLLAQVRRAGRVRRERTDWATLLVAIFVLAGFPVQVIIGVTTQAAPDGTPVIPQGLWLAAGVLLAAVIFAVATAIGPVRVSLPEYSWVLGGPDRPPLRARAPLGRAAAGHRIGGRGGRSGRARVRRRELRRCWSPVGSSAARSDSESPPPQRVCRDARRGCDGRVQRVVMTAVGVGLAAATVLAAARAPSRSRRRWC